MRLYYKQYSTSGRPLVILHGLFGQQGNWAMHAKTLSEDFAVYSIDARNHGRSGWRDSMTYREMAEDVLETMDEAGLKHADFIGHSMGGKTAMQLSLLAPERVGKLLVVDIAPVAYDSGPDEVLEALKALDLHSISSRGEADDALSERIQNKAIRDFLLTNLKREPDGFQWRMNLEVIAKCYDNLKGAPDPSGTFNGDVLFIKGSDSNYLDLRYQDATLAVFPRASVKVVESAGHWVHSEKPEAFIKLASRFLKD